MFVINEYHCHLRLYLLKRCCLTGIGISIIYLRRFDHRIRFMIGILIPIRRCLLSKQIPWIIAISCSRTGPRAQYISLQLHGSKRRNVYMRVPVFFNKLRQRHHGFGTKSSNAWTCVLTGVFWFEYRSNLFLLGLLTEANIGSTGNKRLYYYKNQCLPRLYAYYTRLWAIVC